MKIWKILLLATTIAAMGTAYGQGRLEKIKSTGEITIGHRDASIPFSYLDDQQTPVGYSMDICAKVVDDVKQKLGLDTLNVKLVPVTSSTRIPLVANGTVDLVCGSATNTVERQKQVSFAPTTFVTATRYAAKKSSNINSLDDLNGKTVVSTAGTSNIRWLTAVNESEGRKMRIIPTKDHPAAMLTVANGRAVAFFMDDILLASLVATERQPDEWMISQDTYTVEPYAIMEPKNDPEFKKVVDDSIAAMMKDGTLATLYKKWFEMPIPPKNVNLNLPMSEALARAVANPTDSPDPADYQ
ncbi:amino acid ABC transporter substrate-binding protein [Allopusillimonas ginsengisoli]|uniref:amino acid ABC transporter substrate-binding protein n=1 Tax=Allopusillimonas ginsengisoli TaxID=453575 RepID=UPI001020CFD3|nr:amino acid ABC transporter substrate-binding protein [Allopusillimonas ginsengisoli]TEA79774.1 amino acid ABC transporter substrate-binding protein [Allopusillimonas ginsengisoli]